MNVERRCRNYAKCKCLIEPERPRQSQYCKVCGANRSRDWKREHPEKAKLYGSVNAAKEWREKHNWNGYIQDWRIEHHEQYRKQNRLHLQVHREFRKRKHLLCPVIFSLLAAVAFLVSAPHAIASSLETYELFSRLDFYDHFLIKITMALGLTLFCVRILMNELKAVRRIFRKKNGHRANKKNSKKHHSTKRQH